MEMKNRPTMSDNYETTIDHEIQDLFFGFMPALISDVTDSGNSGFTKEQITSVGRYFQEIITLCAITHNKKYVPLLTNPTHKRIRKIFKLFMQWSKLDATGASSIRCRTKLRDRMQDQLSFITTHFVAQAKAVQDSCNQIHIENYIDNIRNAKLNMSSIGLNSIDRFIEWGMKQNRDARDARPIQNKKQGLVLLVHGIRTRAAWMNSIRPTLEEHDFNVELTNYEWFDLCRFLLPIGIFRRAAREKVWVDMRMASKDHPGDKVSIIAHSFGTYLLVNILKDKFELKVHRIIFCGSVVRARFPFEQIMERFSQPILNETGSRDIWPLIADSVTWGFNQHKEERAK